MGLHKLQSKTPGIDGITYSMIKNLDVTVKDRLISLFNSILRSYIPQSYKTSLVVPILKPNTDKTSISSYRPISLNTCCSKVLDKIIANRLWWFVTTNNLLNSHQFGFRKGKSLADPLIFLDYLINSSIKTRKHISIVSLDFAKAFDKIGIHTILKQLEEWGIGHRVYNYIKNYLTNRKIKVRVDSCYSETRNLYNGIPQGSPLSVVLFLIAYNSLSDLLQSHKDISFISYADDFLIIKKLSSEINGNINMDQIIDEIEDWCKFSGAELSLQKCKHLHICRNITARQT